MKYATQRIPRARWFVTLAVASFLLSSAPSAQGLGNGIGLGNGGGNTGAGGGAADVKKPKKPKKPKKGVPEISGDAARLALTSLALGALVLIPPRRREAE